MSFLFLIDAYQGAYKNFKEKLSDFDNRKPEQLLLQIAYQKST
ncbi:hypothetical protein FORMB_20200 [Formosa sp. Hel1_33_131]|nr:hypothetical protein FORMB_20200 [Formosa sp. Hel1_33_131]